VRFLFCCLLSLSSVSHGLLDVTDLREGGREGGLTLMSERWPDFAR